MSAVITDLMCYFRNFTPFAIAVAFLSARVFAAELPPPPTACGDASSAYGEQCSLQELVDAGLDFDEAFISSAGWRLFNFQDFSDATIGPGSVLVTVNDDDPNNPVVTFTPDAGAMRFDANNDIGQYSASFDIIDLSGNTVISGNAFRADVVADYALGNQVNCSQVTNRDFEGGFMFVGTAVLTRFGTPVPESATRLLFPPEAFPNYTEIHSAPVMFGGAPLPGNAGAQFYFNASGGICYDEQQQPVGSAELESLEMTVSLNGGLLPPPVFAELVDNNSFGSGLDGWGQDESGGCTATPGIGAANLACDGSDLNGAVVLSQVLDTPNESYDVLFDHKFLTTTGVLLAELIPPAGSGLSPRILTSVQAIPDLPGVFTRERILVNETEWMGLQGATLQISLVPGSSSGALVSNIGIQGPSFETSPRAVVELSNSIADNDPATNPVYEGEFEGSVVAPFTVESMLVTELGNPTVVATSAARAELIVGGPLDGAILAKPSARVAAPTHLSSSVRYSALASAKGIHHYMAVPEDPSNPPPAGTNVDVSVAWNLTGTLHPGLKRTDLPQVTGMGSANVDVIISIRSNHAHIAPFTGSISGKSLYAEFPADEVCCEIDGDDDYANAEDTGEAFLEDSAGEVRVAVASNRLISGIISVPVFSLLEAEYDVDASVGGHASSLDEVLSNPSALFDQTLELELLTTTPGFKIVPLIEGEPPSENQPPIADAGGNSTVEATSFDGATVMLDGSGSSDPDGDPLTFTWNGIFGSESGQSPTVVLPLGIHIISLMVDDGNGGTASSNVTVTVVDTTAPTIEAPADLTVVATGAGTIVDLGTPAVSDVADASPTIEALVDGNVINPSSYGFPVGKTTVTWRATDASGNSATDTQEVTVNVVVALDIKPGDEPNCFNNDGNGVIPVAILGSDGSSGFAPLDVMAIDVASLSLEGLAVAVRGKNKLLVSYEDVNGDGLTDVVVHLQDADGAFTSGTGIATITGTLTDGTTVEGSDSICVVP